MWAGISLYFTFREYREKLRREKRRKIIKSVILPIVVIVFIVFGFFQEKDSFLFGFSQNLLADLVLILLAIYIIPEFFNKPKIFKVSLKNDCFTECPNSEKFQVIFKIKNEGKEVFEKGGIFWELFISSDWVEQQNIQYINGNCESNNDEIPIPSWKFSGLINQPLFIDQEIILLNKNSHQETDCPHARFISVYLLPLQDNSGQLSIL